MKCRSISLCIFSIAISYAHQKPLLLPSLYSSAGEVELQPAGVQEYYAKGYTFVPLVVSGEGEKEKICVKASLQKIYRPYMWYLFPFQIVSRACTWGLKKAGLMNISVVSLEDKLKLYAYMQYKQHKRARAIADGYNNLTLNDEMHTDFFGLVKTFGGAPSVINAQHIAHQKAAAYHKNMMKLQGTILQELSNQGKAYTLLAYMKKGPQLIAEMAQKKNQEYQNMHQKSKKIINDIEIARTTIEELQKNVKSHHTTEMIDALKSEQQNLVNQLNALALLEKEMIDAVREAANHRDNIQQITHHTPVLHKKCKQLLAGQYKKEVADYFIDEFFSSLPTHASIDRWIDEYIRVFERARVDGALYFHNGHLFHKDEDKERNETQKGT